MRSLIDDLRVQFIGRYGAVAQLILINIAVFLVLGIIYVVNALMMVPLDVASQRLYEYIALPLAFERILFRPWTILTHMFVHHGVFHILFNMLWLYWMGRLFRQFAGDQPVWGVYLLGALTGAFLLILGSYAFPLLRADHMVGASAGVSAIVVATGVLLPDYTIFLLIFGPVRLKWLTVVFVLLNFLMIAYNANNAGGHVAHLGGALFGAMYVVYRRQGINLIQPYEWLVGQIKRLQARQQRSTSRMRVVYQNTSSKTDSSRQERGSFSRPSEQEINRILDKIQRVGYEKLTQDEKQTLLKASQD